MERLEPLSRPWTSRWRNNFIRADGTGLKVQGVPLTSLAQVPSLPPVYSQSGSIQESTDPLPHAGAVIRLAVGGEGRVRQRTIAVSPCLDQCPAELVAEL